MILRLLRGVWLALWDALWAKIAGPTVVWHSAHDEEGWDGTSPIRSQHLA